MSLTPTSYLSASRKPNENTSRASHDPAMTKICFAKYGKSNVPLFYNDQNSRTISTKTTGFHGNNFPHHPLKEELQRLPDDEPCFDEEGGGIGIVKFFHGKNIFITGGTGLVGKVFIEKLLRSTSVGKIYVLIKAQDQQAALDRLQKDIINSELFQVLGEIHGNDYETFIQEKLVPVVGNICESNLGMDSESAQQIINHVDVIVGSAACTTFHDRYDVLLDTNVSATQGLMKFAKSCKNLKLFVHISTAFVNGRKEGMINEKPLALGETGRNQVDGVGLPASVRLDLADEISLATKARASSSDSDVTKHLKRLGFERANYFGWNNVYQMTKAMGEMALDEIRGETPVLIIRPTVIKSSYKEPFPGWIQGNRMLDPVIISHGKGQLPAFLADPDTHLDIIPVDMVVNATIAAIAKHGVIDKAQLNIYQVASGVENPLRFADIFQIIHEYFQLNPWFMANNIKKVECFNNFEDFSKYTRDEILRLHNAAESVDVDGKISDKKCRVKVAYAEQLCKMYEFMGFFKGRFHTGNTIKLLSEMSKEERVEFEIDAKKIDWRKYFMDAHIPGLKKYVMA